MSLLLLCGCILCITTPVYSRVLYEAFFPSVQYPYAIQGNISDWSIRYNQYTDFYSRFFLYSQTPSNALNITSGIALGIYFGATNYGMDSILGLFPDERFTDDTEAATMLRTAVNSLDYTLSFYTSFVSVNNKGQIIYQRYYGSRSIAALGITPQQDNFTSSAVQFATGIDPMYVVNSYSTPYPVAIGYTAGNTSSECLTYPCSLKCVTCQYAPFPNYTNIAHDLVTATEWIHMSARITPNGTVYLNASTESGIFAESSFDLDISYLDAYTNMLGVGIGFGQADGFIVNLTISTDMYPEYAASPSSSLQDSNSTTNTLSSATSSNTGNNNMNSSTTNNNNSSTVSVSTLVVQEKEAVDGNLFLTVSLSILCIATVIVFCLYFRLKRKLQQYRLEHVDATAKNPAPRKSRMFEKALIFDEWHATPHEYAPVQTHLMGDGEQIVVSQELSSIPFPRTSNRVRSSSRHAPASPRVQYGETSFANIA